jgi:hypothetical protein
MSRVILELAIIFDDFGVDVVPGSGILEAELDDVDENVRFRSRDRLTMTNSSSKNFLEAASVSPWLSCLTS